MKHASKAKLLQLKLIHIFARAILLMKKLEIEKTKPTFIISVLKVEYYVVLVSSISNIFSNKISNANKWMRKKISTCTNSALNMYNFLNVIQNTYCLFILIQQAKLIYDSFRINWIFFKVDNRSLSACTFAEHLSKKNWISISRILSYIET